jgi:hypothetical protein
VRLVRYRKLITNFKKYLWVKKLYKRVTPVITPSKCNKKTTVPTRKAMKLGQKSVEKILSLSMIINFQVVQLLNLQKVVK